MALQETDLIEQVIPRRRPLSTTEYFELAESGRFDDERVELIDGEIVTMAPIGEIHRGIVSLINYDRQTKALIYSQSNIPEYWIVNLIDMQVEVHRNPTPDGYTEITIYQPSQFVSPLCHPTANVAVADLLP